MTSLLKCYFPQVLSWFPDLSTVLVCDFLWRWPALERLRGVKPTTLLNFFRAHHSVRAVTLEKRLAAIKESVPLTTDRAVINSSVLMITALAAQMKPPSRLSASLIWKLKNCAPLTLTFTCSSLCPALVKSTLHDCWR